MLKFKITEPVTDDAFLLQYTSECGRLVAGIYPVVFGFRVRVGLVNDYFFPVDLCAGNEKSDVEFLLSAVLNILEQREFGKGMFLFPIQEVKPFMKDGDQLIQLLQMIKSDTWKREILPDIHEMKRNLLNKLFGYESPIVPQVKKEPQPTE